MIRRKFLNKIICSTLGIMGFNKGISQTQKPILNVFLVIDLSEPSRVNDRKADLMAMEAFFESCARMAGMDIQVKRFTNGSFSSSALLNAIRKLDNLPTSQPPNSGIAVYFSGHGANYGEEIYPTLSFRGNEGLKMSELSRVVGDRKPRLRFILADCCNNFLSSKLPSTEITREIAHDNREFVQKLFWNFDDPQICRSVLICAAERGDVSMSTDSGSIFQQIFRKAFTQTSNTSKVATWTLVKARTIAEMDLFFSQRKDSIKTIFPQTPIFNIFDTRR